MEAKSYSEPVSRLLTYGEADWSEWADYSGLGFKEEHIPELIRLGTDAHLLLDDVDESESFWAPMHAWRVLELMNSTEAVGPLVELFDLDDQSDSDLISEGLLDVIVRYGPAAIDHLANFLLETRHEGGGLVGAGEALARIGNQHPEHRDRIVQLISAALEARYAGNAPDINGFWICDLMDLKAVESYPVIAKAFEEETVDFTIVGDLEDVQVELGLLEKRKTRRPDSAIERAFRLGLERGSKPPKPFASIPMSKADKKEKAKQKQAKKSRKKNRKK
jgi:hypothetical protein